jgi:hypothetical protein
MQIFFWEIEKKGGIFFSGALWGVGRGGWGKIFFYFF